MTNHEHAQAIISSVRDALGISLTTSTDANGSYLHGRLDGGMWVVATDAEGYDYALPARIAHETAPTCECCGDDRDLSVGLGWSVGIYRNCARCGDDHPATHDDDGSVADVVVYDALADALPNIIRDALGAART